MKTDEQIAGVMLEIAKINVNGTLQEWITLTANKCQCTEQDVGQALGRTIKLLKKERDTFIINYEGKPLVIIHNTEFKLPTDVLDWYAENYAFERKKLSWSAVREITML